MPPTSTPMWEEGFWEPGFWEPGFWVESAGADWYLTDQVSGDGWPILQFGGSAPATATTATGWQVEGLAAGQYARLEYGVVRPTTDFSGTAQPSGGPDNTLKDGWRTASRWTIDAPAGNWTFRIPLIAQISPGGTGRARFRLWTSPNADGSGATELTAGAVVCSTVTNVQTGTPQTSTGTASLGAVNVSSVYLFLQVAFETV